MAGSETGDYREAMPVNPVSEYRYNSLLSSISVSINHTLDVFDLLPAAAVAAGTDKFHLLIGANTPVAAQSPTSGLLLTTGATNTNQSGIAGVATTGMSRTLTATNGLVFRARVNLTSLATMLATIGLSTAVASIAINQGAADQAQFLADPTNSLTGTTGATAAQAANWILCTNVAGTSAFIFTTVSLVAGQDVELSIVLNANLTYSYFINHSLIGTSAASATANATVRSLVGVETLTAATASMAVRYDEIETAVGQ